MDQHHLGVGAKVGELGYRVSALAKARLLVGPSDQSCPGAEHRPSGGAALANAAEDRQAADNAVAGRHVVHLTAHCFHRSSRLVSQEHRHGRGVKPFYEVEIAMANSRGAGADQDFSGAWRCDVNFLDLQWLVYLMQHGCFHGQLLLIRLGRISRLMLRDIIRCYGIRLRTTSGRPAPRTSRSGGRARSNTCGAAFLSLGSRPL